VEVARGAEAVLYMDNGLLVKERVSKGYRIGEIDDALRLSRMRREVRMLEKVDCGPRVYDTDERKMSIKMEFIDGDVLRDVLDLMEEEKMRDVMVRLGRIFAGLHDKDIIHGDLTTSNVLLTNEKKNENDRRIYLIDFGLSFVSKRAVELRLFLQALESGHFMVAEECFGYFLDGYKIYSGYDGVMKRLEKVERRGRYKRKGV